MRKLFSWKKMKKSIRLGLLEAAAIDWLDQTAWKGGWFATMLAIFVGVLAMWYSNFEGHMMSRTLYIVMLVFSAPISSVIVATIGTGFIFSFVGFAARVTVKFRWRQVTGQRFRYSTVAAVLTDLAADIDVGPGKTAPQAAKDRFALAHSLAYHLCACPGELKYYIAQSRKRMAGQS